MRVKIREILDDCIADGLRSGYRRAHKYDDEPCEETMISHMEDYIWLEIDRKFDFERNLCSEIMEGFNTPIPTPDHPDTEYVVFAKDGDEVRTIRFGEKEEVDRLRAKKKEIYEDLKDAVDREWVGLTREEQGDWIWDLTHKNINVWDLCDRVEAKLKEKNT